MFFDDLLEKMQQRVTGYLRSGRIDMVVGESAMAEAAALWDAAQPTDPDSALPEDLWRLAAARHILGWLYLSRFHAITPDAAGLSELARAIVMVEPLAGDDAAIPEPLQVYLGSTAAADDQADLADDLQQYAETVPGLIVLDAAIILYTAALPGISVDDLNWVRTLSNCGVTYRMRYERDGVSADLEQAIVLGERAVSAAPPDHPHRPAMLSNLGLAYQVRYERGGAESDLDRAVELGEQALAAAAADDPERGAMLSNLAIACRMRFGSRGTPADLDRSIELSEQAIAQIAPDYLRRAGLLFNVGVSLRWRFQRRGLLADLDQAMELIGQAVTATSSDDPERAGMLSNLANAHFLRFERRGERADLDAAIEMGQQAITATTPGHHYRAGMLTALANAYHRRFMLTGALDDEQRAVELGEQTVAAAPVGSPGRAMWLSNLGNTYHARYQRSGVLADVDRAVELGEQAVTAAPLGSPDRAMYLSNLSTMYLTRYQRSGVLADVDRAVELGEQAVTATPLDSPDRPMRLYTLGNAYHTRYERGRAQADVEGAIEIIGQAVASTPCDHPNRALYLSGLSNAYLRRYQPGGALDDIDRAIDLGEQAISATPADQPYLATLLSNLGSIYRERVHAGGQGADSTTLYALADQVAAAVTSQPFDRVRAGLILGWLALAVHEHSLAVRLLDEAVALVPLVAPRESGWEDQEHRLGELRGLVVQVVVAHCAINDPVGAMETAELGRGVLLAAQLDVRADITDLAHAHPELATRLRRLRDQLNTPPTTDTQPGGAPPEQTHNRIEDRKRRWAEHDELLTEIRRRPGFDRFLRPPRLTDVQPALRDGAVVLVNVDQRRSDAIILTDHGDPVLIRLPDLAFDDFLSHALALLDSTHDTGLAAVLRRQRVIPEILGWLWDTIVHPILQAAPLQAGKQEPLPRIWWLPTGLLGLFPLHAAGHPGRPGALDTIISSYTPTLRALAHARARPPATIRRQLTVALQHTPGLPDLPGTVAEATDLHARHPDIPLLLDHAATTDAVLAALPKATWAHFACHASVDFTTSSRSGLALHNATLSLPEISRLDLTHAELAYLSACSTAHRGIWRVDESLHPASAFQLAGFRHVIASLWPLTDRIAAAAATNFYQHLPATPTADHAAIALHHTTRELRTQYPDRPDLWAALIHSGP
ncbi:CHAT domain-containing protein [Nocardia niwae]|uniref:CHAT domain-containing protein n=1 Tax=Nocardia niwae TaxID=626084 RepID=UPI0033CAF68F